MEIGMKPMLIGVMSPVVYIEGGEPEDDEERLTLVTYFTLPAEIESIDLNLELKIHREGCEMDEQSFSRTVSRDDSPQISEPWSGVIPLPLKIPNAGIGTKIEADLNTNCGSAWASLNFAAPEDAVIELPKRKRKKVRALSKK